ncbi:exodeoxyribonuclease VII large subunit [Lentisphaerota bacterium WC36G]|nr:exodeoxyribonuclease VII large subunit [Lentisphaerae bacterium WC36]
MNLKNDIWSVSDVNRAIRDIIENSFMPFWISGEVGTLNIHSSGHVYMTLKDNKSQLKVVFFKGASQARAINLQVGMAIEIFGNLTVYEVRGEYQFNAKNIRIAGVGSLQQQFEELKRKLYNEGLFEQSLKKSLPKIPKCIGVISSSDGAAVRDFLQVAERRFPKVNIKIFPAQMQGEGAGISVKRGLEYFNKSKDVDVIVITRGGGSMEDLWAFNEELLARSVVNSKIPVVSAIGHEIDFTIVDFVADVRAATPSAAAEIIVPELNILKQNIANGEKLLLQNLKYALDNAKQRLRYLANSQLFREPKYALQFKQQQIDELSIALEHNFDEVMKNYQHRLKLVSQSLSLKTVQNILMKNQQDLHILQNRLTECYSYALTNQKQRLKIAETKIKAFNPEAIINRGFAVITSEDDGTVLTSVADFKHNQSVSAKLKDGSVKFKVR